jgi:hypothetical protein
MRQVLIQQEIRDDLWRAQDAFGTVVNTLVGEFTAGKATLDETSTKIRQAAGETADRVIQILTTISKETGAMDPKTEQAASQKALKDMSHEEILKHAEDLAGLNTDLAGKVQAAEVEKAKSAALQAAEVLVVLMEKKGRAFADPAARQAEVDKLAALSDEARKAVADTWSALPDKAADKSGAPAKETPAGGEGGGEGTQAATAAGGGALRANAGLTPATGGDLAPQDLKTKLAVGFQAAYEERVARERGEAPASGGAE